MKNKTTFFISLVVFCLYANTIACAKINFKSNSVLKEMALFPFVVSETKSQKMGCGEKTRLQLAGAGRPISSGGFETAKRSQKVTFTENKGQVSDQDFKSRPDVLFSGTADGLLFHLRKNGITYQLHRVDSWKPDDSPLSSIEGLLSEKREVADKTSIFRIDINWINFNRDLNIVTDEKLPGYENYYLRACPEGISNVRTFVGITYKNIYKDIDLHYYEKNGSLKYDYLVSAGADYHKIEFRIEGAESVTSNAAGDLILKTPLGNIIEQAPVVLQNGKKLKARWVIREFVLSFAIDDLQQGEPFIIDPVIRAWGTYYGGGADDFIRTCVPDGNGNVYAAGLSGSSSGTLIATSGAHQTSFGGGQKDAFLAKFDSTGLRLWSTYYGDSGYDDGSCCSLDANGNVYLVGYTDSNNAAIFATPGAHQTVYAGGNWDAFLAKFDPAGIRQWSTYYGDGLSEWGTYCATDISGNIYICGSTMSTSGMGVATPGSHQPVNGGSGYDAFLAKFSSTGVRQWGTYYGGSDTDTGWGCATDLGGNVFLAGYAYTSSGTSIASAGSHQQTFGGVLDAFIVKFNALGVRQWGTYYGGAGNDFGYACSTDLFGNVYMSGYTSSSTGSAIATLGSHQSIYGGGQQDAFLVKFNSGGVRQWGTYYGGAGTETGRACSSDWNSNVYMAGTTDSGSGNVIASPGSHQALNGGGNDALLVKFNSAGIRQWGTYYGGAGSEGGSSCSTDAASNIYISGGSGTASGTAIVTPGTHQASYAGGTTDGFLVKFKGCQSPTITAASSRTNVCSGDTITLSTGGATSYTWIPGGLGTSIIQSPTVSTTFIVVASEANVCTNTALVQVMVAALPTLSIVSSNSLICAGMDCTLTGSGASSYTWNTLQNSANITVSPTINTTYTLVGSNGCKSSKFFTQYVDACLGLDATTKYSGQLSVYPNPASDHLNINLTDRGDLPTVTLYEATGRVVYHKKVDSQSTLRIELSSFDNGIYFLEISEKEQLTRNKIIKQ